MGLRDTLRLAKQAMSPDAMRQAMEAAKDPPSQAEIDAAVAAMTPEQRAAYEANMACVAEAEAQAAANQA